VSIQPLLDDRSVYLLREGLGYLYSYTLEQHRQYLPSKYSRTYKPFALYEKNHTDTIAKSFIKNEGVYFPQDNFDTYVSLLGGSISDISFVLENFQDKRLVLNETENSLYGVLLSIRDYPEETIGCYKKIVSYYLQAKSSKEACFYYKKIKTAFYESLGSGRLSRSCGVLLFLLHTGTHTTPLYGIEAEEYYQKKVSTLCKWHYVLSSPKVSLYHTDDYTSIPLPTVGKNFIVANAPEYTVGESAGWSSEQVRSFCRYYRHLDATTDSYLLVSSNTSPMFRSNFCSKNNWHTYKVVSDMKYPALLYNEQHHKNNMDRCFCSNYQLSLPVSNLTPKNSFHTKELLDLYQDYCSGLI